MVGLGGSVPPTSVCFFLGKNNKRKAKKNSEGKACASNSQSLPPSAAAERVADFKLFARTGTMTWRYWCWCLFFSLRLSYSRNMEHKGFNEVRGQYVDRVSESGALSKLARSSTYSLVSV